MKALYRLIIRADGQVQPIDTTLDDYRTVSSLPMAAGNVSTNASAITVNPFGDISNTVLQLVLEEMYAKRALFTGDISLDGASAHSILMKVSGTTYGNYAISTNSNEYCTGSASGDTIIRSDGKKIFFSTDNGTTADLVLNGRNAEFGGYLSSQYHNDVRSVTAGENLILGNIAYLKSDGKYWKAKGDALATIDSELVYVLGTINANNSGNVLFEGMIITTSLTEGTKYYVSASTAGDSTTSAPSTEGQYIRQIMAAMSTTMLKFKPSDVIIGV
jgi:hypothetical protein